MYNIVETTTNQQSIHNDDDGLTKKKKKKIENVLSRSQVLYEYRKKWESELLKLPDVSSIQRSTIYKVEDNMERIQRKLTRDRKSTRLNSSH